MASKSERQPKLKICIDNTDPVEEMEEGEVDDSDEDDIIREVRHNKSAFSSRSERSRLELVQQRPLPSPVVSDEEVVTVDLDDLETFGVSKKPKTKVYENPARSGFELGFDPTSEEAVKKKNERAKRFGIPAEETPHLDEESLKQLYGSLKVTAPSNGFDERGVRFDAIHLRGTDNLSTEDVFEYFQKYKPKSVEWIDDSSCNVIWSDKAAAARAILGLSEDPSVATETDSTPLTHDNATEDQADKENKENESQPQPMVTDSTEQAPVEKGSEEVEKNDAEEGVELFEEEDDDLNLMSSDDEMEQGTSKIEQPKKISIQQKPVAMTTSGDTVRMEASDGDSDQSDKETSHKRDQKSINTDQPKVVKKTSASKAGNTKLMKRILPPGNWRLGHPCEKAKFLFMRFATKADRKLPGAERKSQYYKTYGNPNYGGMTGLISASRKRKIRSAQYWNELGEENYRRKNEQYYQGNTEEMSFDEQLRQAKRARRLESTSDPEDSAGYPSRRRRRHYSEGSEENPVDDLSSYWAAAEDESEFVLGKRKIEEEMDMERELGELMKKAPSYRYGRMYADDLEDQIRAKKQETQTMTFEVVDDVISTVNRHSRKTISRPKQHERGRRRYHSDDEQEVIVKLNHPQHQQERTSRDLRRASDLRSQLEKKKAHKKGPYPRHEEGYGKNSPAAEVELELGVEEDESDELQLSPQQREGKFKYEKLRIQVHPDDV